MADGYNDNYSKLVIGEGLYDQELEDLPPRFKKKYKMLEKKLYEDVNKLLYDVDKQHIQNASSHIKFYQQMAHRVPTSNQRAFSGISKIITRRGMSTSVDDRNRGYRAGFNYCRDSDKSLKHHENQFFTQDFSVHSSDKMLGRKLDVDVNEVLHEVGKQNVQDVFSRLKFLPQDQFRQTTHRGPASNQRASSSVSKGKTRRGMHISVHDRSRGYQTGFNYRRDSDKSPKNSKNQFLKQDFFVHSSDFDLKNNCEIFIPAPRGPEVCPIFLDTNNQPMVHNTKSNLSQGPRSFPEVEKFADTSKICMDDKALNDSETFTISPPHDILPGSCPSSNFAVINHVALQKDCKDESYHEMKPTVEDCSLFSSCKKSSDFIHTSQSCNSTVFENLPSKEKHRGIEKEIKTLINQSSLNIPVDNNDSNCELILKQKINTCAKEIINAPVPASQHVSMQGESTIESNFSQSILKLNSDVQERNDSCYKSKLSSSVQESSVIEINVQMTSNDNKAYNDSETFTIPPPYDPSPESNFAMNSHVALQKDCKDESNHETNPKIIGIHTVEVCNLISDHSSCKKSSDFNHTSKSCNSTVFETFPTPKKHWVIEKEIKHLLNIPVDNNDSNCEINLKQKTNSSNDKDHKFRSVGKDFKNKTNKKCFQNEKVEKKDANQCIESTDSWNCTTLPTKTFSSEDNSSIILESDEHNRLNFNSNNAYHLQRNIDSKRENNFTAKDHHKISSQNKNISAVKKHELNSENKIEKKENSQSNESKTQGTISENEEKYKDNATHSFKAKPTNFPNNNNSQKFTQIVTSKTEERPKINLVHNAALNYDSKSKPINKCGLVPKTSKQIYASDLDPTKVINNSKFSQSQERKYAADSRNRRKDEGALASNSNCPSIKKHSESFNKTAKRSRDSNAYDCERISGKQENSNYPGTSIKNFSANDKVSQIYEVPPKTNSEISESVFSSYSDKGTLLESEKRCETTPIPNLNKRRNRNSTDSCASSIELAEESYKPIIEVIKHKQQENRDKLLVTNNASCAKKFSNKQNANQREKIDKLFEREHTNKEMVGGFLKKCQENEDGSVQDKEQDTNTSVMVTYVFSLKLTVSKDVEDLDYWKNYLKGSLGHVNFIVDNPDIFSQTLTVIFDSKEKTQKARITLLQLKGKCKSSEEPHVVKVSSFKPVKDEKIRKGDTKQRILSDCLDHIEEESKRYINAHNEKIIMKEKELKSDGEGKSAVFEAISNLRTMKCVFQAYVEKMKKEIMSLKSNDNKANQMAQVKNIKTSFHRECNSFVRCLPVYSKKDEILKMVEFNQASIIVAETGSGKSTQLVEYFLQAGYGNNGYIICTQPRKVAAISIAEYVSGQLGSPVGKVVGYDVGTVQKVSEATKVMFTTEFTLLKRCVKKGLNGISCIIVDEAHERTLYTDILLGIIRSNLHKRPKIRIVITSATIDPTVFLSYFDLSHKAVLKITGRTYPVTIVWLKDDVFIGWNYVEECVKTALKIHLERKTGDILVFLTSPNETEEAMNLLKNSIAQTKCSEQPKLFCLHGKLDVRDQMEIFKLCSAKSRKIIFATNSAETSVTIPGVKYVVDSGMVKEKQYCSHRNKNTLAVTFISKSSSEQRKGRAGRNQSGVCYRMYSKKNFASMPERAQPEILKTNFQLALLKILECGFQPDDFNFVEKPPENLISKSWDSLEHLGAVKNKKLTDLGKKIVHLPFEPCLSKLIIRGISESIGYEAAIIAALLSISGKVFFRSETNKALADERKIKFCKKEGDVCTFLEVFKKWKRLPEDKRAKWCDENCINLKSMKTANSIVTDIIVVLNRELNTLIPRHYSDSIFKSKFETILFECYSENLCIFSGHPKSGYISPYLTDSYFIHPSSSLSYIGCEEPLFMLYGTCMETSRNFLLDVTPIKEETITKAYQKGSFNLQVDMLKDLQVAKKAIGPFGESVLIRYILGKQGSRIIDLESKIQRLCKTKSFYIEVLVDKGQIIIHIEKRFHTKVLQLINSVIDKSLTEMINEEVIQRMNGCYSCCFSLSCGAIINDIIMPGEFRELIFENMKNVDMTSFLTSLKKYGALQTVQEISSNNNKCIHVTFAKVASAEEALLELKSKNQYCVTPRTSPFSQIPKTSAMFRIHVTWCRIPCTGTGWAEFYNFEDCIEASGALTTNSICINDSYIQFFPAAHKNTELYMKNLPETADEVVIKSLLQTRLHKNIKLVTLVRKKIVKVSEKDLISAKQELLQIFKKFTPTSKLLIEVKCPSSNDMFWSALAHFENLEDGENALSSLKDKAKIGKYPLTLEPLLRSSLSCKSDVYEILKKDIHGVVVQFKTSRMCTNFDAKQNSNRKGTVRLTFSCKNINGLSSLRQSLIKMLNGYSLHLKDKYNVITTRQGEKFIKSLELNLKILICFDLQSRTISLYGVEKACSLAKEKICDFVSSADEMKRKVFNLKGMKTPSGFLKTLYEKYGFNLNDLIDKYDLYAACINIHQRTLTIQGPQVKIDQAEECLENLCSDIVNSKDKNVQEDIECCQICFDAISISYQRLENCGHPFCRSCLLLQLESKVIPVVCVKENCHKPFVIEDITRILNFSIKEQKERFYSAALQYYVQQNKDSIRYCPSPDCQMVYRVKKMIPMSTCPACENDICTVCNALYHHGMTCEMFQNCKEDEDYSLKVWLKEDESSRKICPSCRTALEKIGGCNHVECSSCKIHLCWLCLKSFVTSKAVYEHLPLCAKNVTGGYA